MTQLKLAGIFWCLYAGNCLLHWQLHRLHRAKDLSVRYAMEINVFAKIFMDFYSCILSWNGLARLKGFHPSLPFILFNNIVLFSPWTTKFWIILCFGVVGFCWVFHIFSVVFHENVTTSLQDADMFCVCPFGR